MRKLSKVSWNLSHVNTYNYSRIQSKGTCITLRGVKSTLRTWLTNCTPIVIFYCFLYPFLLLFQICPPLTSLPLRMQLPISQHHFNLAQTYRPSPFKAQSNSISSPKLLVKCHNIKSVRNIRFRYSQNPKLTLRTIWSICMLSAGICTFPEANQPNYSTKFACLVCFGIWLFSNWV